MALACRPEEWARLLHALTAGWWFGSIAFNRTGSLSMWARRPGEDPLFGKVHEVKGRSLADLLDAVGAPKVVRNEKAASDPAS